MSDGVPAGEGEKRGELRWSIAMVAIVLLSVVGVAINVESTEVFLNLKIAPDDYVSSCNISEKVNCEDVERSEWAVVAGVPTAMWAIVGYLVMGALAAIGLAGRRQRRERGLLLLLSGFSLVLSLFLIYLMAFEIGSWCTLCLATDAVNLGILVMVLLALRVDRAGALQAVKSDVLWILRSPLALAGHVALAGALVGGAFLADAKLIEKPIAEAEARRKKEMAEAFRLDLVDHEAAANEKAHNPGVDPKGLQWADTAVPSRGCAHGEDCACEEGPGHAHGPKRTTLSMGVDEDGHNWLGAESAALVIHEYTDYECPHCRGAHMRIRRLLSKYPGRIKVVHRHFPLDQACNPMVTRKFHDRACELSRIAVCAGDQGRFWEMNDLLFQHAADIRKTKPSAEALAGRLELDIDRFQCCMTATTSDDHIRRDVNEGMAHKVTGTPAFVIGGKAYLGKIPEEVLGGLD